jgi:hypothetical protein
MSRSTFFGSLPSAEPCSRPKDLPTFQRGQPQCFEDKEEAVLPGDLFEFPK